MHYAVAVAVVILSIHISCLFLLVCCWCLSGLLVGLVWLVRKVLSPVSENVTFGVVDRILQFQSGIKRSFINMLFYFYFCDLIGERAVTVR